MFAKKRCTCGVVALAIAIGAGSAQAQNVPPHVAGRLLVKFSSKATAQQVRDLLARANARITGFEPKIGIHALQLPNDASAVATQRAFAKRPEVVFAELDRIFKPQIEPNDYYYAGWEWHVKKMQCPTAWDTSTGSAGVTIAILDTGVDGAHPDLSAKMVAGWNTYDNNANTSDDYGHGTLVAGAAAASTNNSIGVASVAWGCKIMPIRVADANGNGSASAMASGITWAADHGARIANISYSVTGTASIDAAANYMMSKGGVVVVSAGNDGLYHDYPQDLSVITVGSTDYSDLLYSWSSTGPHIDITAPGTAWTTSRGGGYIASSGTSISAPLVAGVAALLVSANPNLTGQQLMDTLTSTADDLGAAGWDTSYGAGRVNAARAIAAASNGASQPNAPPTVAAAASASSNPIIGNTVGLSVLGADDQGEPGLFYTWSASGPAAVTFSSNNANSAKNVTASFTKAGAYTFTASITDQGGLTATSSVSVNVTQKITSVTVSPGVASVNAGNSQQFAGTWKDQFGATMPAPQTVTWTVNGGGTIDSAGLFKAGSTPGGPFVVTASAGASGSGSVSVVQQDSAAPTVSIVSPTGGVVSTTVAVTASASDDVGVVKVELYVDGKLTSTDTASPWSFSVNTKGWKRGTHKLQCKAYDAAGKVGLSAIVSVTK